MNLKGNYPFAVLHEVKTNGFKSAMKYAAKVAKEKLSIDEAGAYVRACIKTNGQPHLLDLYEV